MRYEDMAEFLATLMGATRDLAARYEQPGEQEEYTKTLADVAESLGLHALLLCSEEGRDVVADCATRLQETAREHGVSYAVDFADRARPDDRDALVTWRELQIAEAAHDRACDPDSQDVAPREQLLRCTLRLASVAGRIADDSCLFTTDELWRPPIDLLLLTLRLFSAAGKELPDRPIPRNDSQLDSALGDEASPYWSL